MTTVNRTLRRETTASLYSKGRTRAIQIILEPGSSMLTMKLKGERLSVQVPIREVYTFACNLKVQMARAAKKREREERRKAKAR